MRFSAKVIAGILVIFSSQQVFAASPEFVAGWLSEVEVKVSPNDPLGIAFVKAVKGLAAEYRKTIPREAAIPSTVSKSEQAFRDEKYVWANSILIFCSKLFQDAPHQDKEHVNSLVTAIKNSIAGKYFNSNNYIDCDRPLESSEWLRTALKAEGYDVRLLGGDHYHCEDPSWCLVYSKEAPVGAAASAMSNRR